MANNVTLGKSRIEALSDGVFSIAMTLLVLKLEVPEVSHHGSNAEMLQQLLAESPAFLSFVVTFLLSGAFWLLHHQTFHFIRHVSRALLWINLIFLLFVSLLPFSAGMMGHLFVHPVSQLFYYGNQLALALVLNIHWRYAGYAGMLDTSTHPQEARRLTYRIASLAIGFAAAFVTALFWPMYSPIPFFAVMIAGAIAERPRRPKP